MARITLTLDNGPHRTYTPAILDVLARRAVPACFFVVGFQVEKPGATAVLDAIRAAGHTIGNHTYSHDVPFGRNRDPDAVTREVVRTSELLAGYLTDPPLFRPFGDGGQLDSRVFSKALIDHLIDGGYTCVLWNCVPRDWERPHSWVETALTEAANLDWATVVVHDVMRDNPEQIDRFIDLARQQGHEFVPDLDPTCLPIVAGRQQQDLSHLTGC